MRGMTNVTDRLSARIRSDFPEPGAADELIARLGTLDHDERVQAAIVLWANGDLSRFEDSFVLTEVDWRDVLVRGGLANDDWRGRLEVALGTGAARA
jgi:hypothetical protein